MITALLVKPGVAPEVVTLDANDRELARAIGAEKPADVDWLPLACDSTGSGVDMGLLRFPGPDDRENRPCPGTEFVAPFTVFGPFLLVGVEDFTDQRSLDDEEIARWSRVFASPIDTAPTMNIGGMVFADGALVSTGKGAAHAA